MARTVPARTPSERQIELRAAGLPALSEPCRQPTLRITLDGARLHVRRSRHLWEYGDPKTASSRRTVELFPEAVHLLRCIQPLHVTPDMPVFTNTRGQPVEPNSLLPHWYTCQRALGIRVRGLYSTKDTYVTAALQVGVKIAWLEQQTGVSYATLRRHYGKWMPTDGEERTPPVCGLHPELVWQGR
jgi:hypothetical protein